MYTGIYTGFLFIQQLVFTDISNNHVSAETLTTGQMIPSGTNSPPAEVVTQ
jgi:hypothetical protein